MGAEEPLLRVEGVGKAYFSNRVLKKRQFYPRQKLAAGQFSAWWVKTERANPP